MYLSKVPVMNGFQFLRNFKKEESEASQKARVVILTTSAHNKDYQEALSYEISDVIQKPHSSNKLVEVLEKLQN